jgi:hypothetical protein
MICLHPDLFVVVEQLDGERAPQPRPLASGFSKGIAYRVLGLHSPSETSEAYFILANDRDEVWFVSNRHFRAHAIVPGATALRMPATQAVLPSGDGLAAYEGDGAALGVPVLCDGQEHTRAASAPRRERHVGSASAL